MKAVMKPDRSPGAEVREIDPPSIGDQDILLEVKAAAICGTDVHIYEWTKYAQDHVTPPMVFGHEFCGEVVEVGSQVTKVQPGDLVAGETHIPCGHCFQCETGNRHICENMAIVGVHSEGAFAEYAKLPEACAWQIPKDRSPELGAIMEPMGVATHGVLVDRVDGRSVVVFGCGPIGLFGIGVADACGASQLFAVEVNQPRLEMAPSMASDVRMINPKKEDTVEAILDATDGRGVDVVIELTGNPVATQQAFKVLRKGGRISLVGLPSEPITLDVVDAIIYREAKVYGTTGRLMWDTWWNMERLLASGKLDPMPVITHRLGLEDIDEAIDLAKSGRAGKILLLP
jgi:threonine 3-dehydrogenase